MRKYILLVLITILSIMSCDPVIHLLINEEEKFFVDYECGEVELTFISTAGHFQLHQNFSVNQSTILNKNNLIIYYNNEIVEFEIFNKDGIIDIEQYVLTTNEKITVSFRPPNGIIIRDVVVISANGYLNCNGHEVDFEELRIVIENDM